jgi:MFS family permease
VTAHNSRSERGELASLIPAVAGATIVSLPVFLVGALSVQISQALGTGARPLSVAVAAYSFGATISAVWLGRMAERFGGLRMMRVSSLLSAVTLLGVAVAARSWAVMAGMMVMAGLAASAMQPATNLLLARRIPRNKQGLAFGVKQAAVPLAACLGGLAVPGIGLVIGWRWAFVAAGLLAAAVGVLLPRPRLTLAAYRATRKNAAAAQGRILPLVVLAVGLGLAVGSAASLTGFLVSAAVDSGASKGTAGLLVALGGASAAASRVLVGALADRRDPVHLWWVAILLGCGACGYGLLSLFCARHLVALLPLAAFVTFSAGWGWNGQFNLAVIRAHDDYPARATGITQMGGRMGAIVVPLVYGAVAARYSYSTAWLVSGGTAASAAAFMVVGRLLLVRTSVSTRPAPQVSTGGCRSPHRRPPPP